MTLITLLLVCAFNSGSEINKWYQLGQQLTMHWIAASKIEQNLTLSKRLLPEYHYTMCIPKCIVEIHAANEHFLICTGYYYGVDTQWSSWKRIQQARGVSGACNMSGCPIPTVSGHVCMAACGAVHKHTGLLSAKRFFYSQTCVEKHQPTPVPDRKIHPNIYFSWPCSGKMVWTRQSPEYTHTSGILW